VFGCGSLEVASMRALVLLVGVLVMLAFGIGFGLLSQQRIDILLLTAMICLLIMPLQQRFWCAETLLLCDRPSEELRGIIDLAVARWAEGRPRRFRVVSEMPAGVVLQANLGWQPGIWQRIAVTAEEGSIRVVSEATVPQRREGWQNLAAVREQVSRSIEWARGRSREEIDHERQRGALAGPA
jgi:hypothetical protein